MNVLKFSIVLTHFLNNLHVTSASMESKVSVLFTFLYLNIQFLHAIHIRCLFLILFVYFRRFSSLYLGV